MRTEIMTTVLTKLNSKMKRGNRHIILFLDNASCHPSSLKGVFSNVQIKFSSNEKRHLTHSASGRRNNKDEEDVL